MEIKNLLESITSAIIIDTSLTTILLKCQLLSHKINSQILLDWVNHELNGYSDNDEIPQYRLLTVSEIYASFMNSYGQITTRTIPFGLDIAEPFATQLYHGYLHNSVAELEAFEAKCKNETNFNLKLKLHGSFYPVLEDCFGGDPHKIQDAWQIFAGQNISGVLASIKNKLLEFVCELGKAHECDFITSDIMQTKTIQIFNNTIQSLNTGPGTINNNGNNIAMGDNATITLSESQKAQLTEIWEQINNIKSRFEDDSQEIAEYLFELKNEIDTKITCPSAIRKTLRAIKTIVNKAGEYAIEKGIDQCITVLSQSM